MYMLLNFAPLKWKLCSTGIIFGFIILMDRDYCVPRYNNQLTLMRRDLKNCKGKIAEQQKQILEYASRFDEADKKNEETSRKFSTLLQVSVDS